MSIPIEEIKKEEEEPLPQAKLELIKYGLCITFIWGCSMIPSLIGLYFYHNFIFKPYQDQIAAIIPIFIKWKVFGIVALSSFILILAYLFRLLWVIIFTKIALIYCNKRSPRKELVGAAGYGKEEAKVVNYYHLRGTILRIFKWIITKSAFPWLTTWAFNFVGANDLGKGTIMEDQFFCQEYLETGENVYIGQGTQISSHLVEGKYGAITLKKVKIGKNSVIGPHDLISPGCELGPYTEILPMSAIIKFQKVRGFRKYYGLPIFRISRHRYMDLLQIPKTPETYENRILKLKQLKRKYRAEHQREKNN